MDVILGNHDWVTSFLTVYTPDWPVSEGMVGSQVTELQGSALPAWSQPR